jgi:nucleoside-triphosphatase THEP1
MSNIFIVTGPIGGGKTSRLLEWCKTKEDVAGIATPIVENKRMFFDLKENELFKMEYDENEEEVFKIGKYVFGKNAFIKAIQVLKEGIASNPQWLVIDEIGPLELKGEGFSEILFHILKNSKRKYNLVLVIRDSKLEEGLKYFGIHDYQFLENISC